MTNDTIKIQNLTRRVMELHAPHADVCVRLGRCLCSRTGACAVLRLMPAGTAGDCARVAPAWAHSPAVKAALLRKAIKVSGPSTTNAAPASAPAPKPARRRGAKE